MHIDWKAMREAFISLLISLCGLLLMFSSLYKVIDHPDVQPMHYLFILNSMLSFKNNIELNYADIMSSTVQKISIEQKNFPFSSIFEYVFDCGSKMFYISALASILIGSFSNYANIYHIFCMEDAKKHLLIIGTTISISFFTGICSSITTFIAVVSCITTCVYFKCNPDNIILPIIASFADYITTLSLTYFSSHIYAFISQEHPKLFSSLPSRPSYLSSKIFTFNCTFILIISFALFGVYMKTKERKMPQFFKIWSLALSFCIIVVSGSLINLISSWNKQLAILIPLFNGLSGSIALIYISKVTTYTLEFSNEAKQNSILLNTTSENEENPRSAKTLFFLLFVSALLSFFSYFSIRLLFPSINSFYVLIIGVLIIVETFILYNFVNLFTAALKLFNIELECHAVPLLNASSDLIGTIIFGGITYLLMM